MKTHYEVLGVSHQADEAEIKRAWARLVRVHTPDQDPDGNRALNEAKTILLDSVARADYDAELTFGEEIQALFGEAHRAMETADFSGAEAVLKEILSLHPGSFDALNQLGLSLILQEKYPAAVKVLEKLTCLAPTSALYVSNLAFAYKQWSEIVPVKSTDAEAYYRKAIELESVNCSHHISLAELFISQERYGEAESLLEEAILADGKADIDDIDTYMKIALVYLLQNKSSSVEMLAERVAASLPTDIEIRRYAAFKFLDIAKELLTKYENTRSCMVFLRSARKVCTNLGDLTEFVNSMERLCRLYEESYRMIEDKSIVPVVVPALFGFLCLKRVGKDVEEHFINELLEAAATWSKADLQAGVSACRLRYPTVMDECSDLSSRIIDIGFGYAGGYSGSNVSRGNVGAAQSSGCGVFAVLTFILTLVLVAVLFV